MTVEIVGMFSIQSIVGFRGNLPGGYLHVAKPELGFQQQVSESVGVKCLQSLKR